MSAFGSTSIASVGGTDALLAKYPRDGNLLWVKRAGGTNNDYGAGTTVDSAATRSWWE